MISDSPRRRPAVSFTRVTVDMRATKYDWSAVRRAGYPSKPKAWAVRTTVASLTPVEAATRAEVENTASSQRLRKKSTTLRCPLDRAGDNRRIRARISSGPAGGSGFLPVARVETGRSAPGRRAGRRGMPPR